MRLDLEQVWVIKEVGQQVLGEGTRVVLFASRVLDHALGATLTFCLSLQHLFCARLLRFATCTAHWLVRWGAKN